jgi:hypothetical protein
MVGKFLATVTIHSIEPCTIFFLCAFVFVNISILSWVVLFSSFWADDDDYGLELWLVVFECFWATTPGIFLKRNSDYVVKPILKIGLEAIWKTVYD